MARILFHPKLVTIQPLDRSNTRTDASAGEPYAWVERSAAVELLAQVEENGRNARRPGPGGATVPQPGVLTFKRSQVELLGWDPQAGDMVVTVKDRTGANSRTVRWYVQDANYSGSRPTRKREDLVVCRFGTRPPSRRQVEGL